VRPPHPDSSTAACHSRGKKQPGSPCARSSSPPFSYLLRLTQPYVSFSTIFPHMESRTALSFLDVATPQRPSFEALLRKKPHQAFAAAASCCYSLPCGYKSGCPSTPRYKLDAVGRRGHLPHNDMLKFPHNLLQANRHVATGRSPLPSRCRATMLHGARSAVILRLAR
jgi:hypothetical protein